MSSIEAAEVHHQVNDVTGRYVLGDQPNIPGLNIFACRLKSIWDGGYIVAAPVIGAVGEPITASFAPFGTMRGRIARHVSDGFAVTLDATSSERSELAGKIESFRHRMWTGAADKRGEQRFLPAEPRSVIVLADGSVLPCLIVDYSASGAAVSAGINPEQGTRVTIGQVTGTVVRGFDVGFAVHFDALQDREEIEHFLEAPDEWRQAVSVIKAQRIDTSEGEDLAMAGGSY